MIDDPEYKTEDRWFRCELRDHDDEDNLLGYFTVLAPRDVGPDSAVSRFYELASDGAEALDAYVDDAVECDDPTIPNDYARTGTLRDEVRDKAQEIAVLRNECLRLRESADQARKELETATLLINSLKAEMRELGRGLVTAAHVALSVGRE